ANYQYICRHYVKPHPAAPTPGYPRGPVARAVVLTFVHTLPPPPQGTRKGYPYHGRMCLSPRATTHRGRDAPAYAGATVHGRGTLYGYLGRGQMGGSAPMGQQ